MSSAPAGLAVRTQKRYGWRPDHPDIRDFLLAVEPAKTLPRKVSLRAKMPPVYDQGGSWARAPRTASARSSSSTR